MALNDPPKPRITLTKEIAEQFLKDNDSLNLEEFEEIDEDAAEILSRSENDFSLYGLSDLSETAAQALAKATCFIALPNDLQAKVDACKKG